MVTVKREGKKFRVVEVSTGSIARNADGNEADHGGHTARIQAQNQADAINERLSRRS